MASIAADVAAQARPRHHRSPPRLTASALALAALFATPVVYLAWRNATTFGDAIDVYLSRRALEPLRNTLLLATAVAVSTSVVGTALAWLSVRSDIPGRRLWAALTPLPLVFPSFVGALALVSSTAPGGLFDEVLEPIGLGTPRIEGFVGAWVVLTLFTYPYVLLPVAARLAALPPSLEESARLLGRGPWTAFRTVVLPQIAGAIRAGALLVFLYTVSDFGAVQLMRYDTLTRVIYATRVLDRTTSLALSLLLGVLAIVVVVVERVLARRMPRIESVRARQPLVVSLGRWRWAAGAGMFAFVALALAGPVVSLALWTSRSRSPLSDSLGDLAAPAANTAFAGAITAVVAVAAVLPVAYLTTRYRSMAAGVSNALVVGAFALPGLVIALALARGVLQVPGLVGLYQTFPLLVFAYVVHFGAQSLRASQVAVAAVPARLDDAARMLGANRVRRFATIDVPLMLPGLAAGAGLVLLSTMKELPATLLLRPFDFDTLATRIWTATEEAALPEAGLASLVLVCVSALLTWFLVVRRTESLD